MVNRWFPVLAWGVAFAAAFVFVISPPAEGNGFSGNVNGEFEQPVIETIADAVRDLIDARLELERERIGGVTGKGPRAEGPSAQAARALLDMALQDLADAIQMIETPAGAFQDETDIDFALESLGSAQGSAQQAIANIDDTKSVKSVLNHIGGAVASAVLAGRSMQGLFVEIERDVKFFLFDLESDPKDFNLAEYREDFNAAGTRAVMKLVGLNPPAGPPSGAKPAKKKKATKKAARRKKAAAKKRTLRKKTKAKPKRKRAKKSKVARKGLVPFAKAPKPPKDFYLAVFPEDKKQEFGGIFDLDMNRQLTPPFCAGATIGFFNEKKIDPDSGAKAFLFVVSRGVFPIVFARAEVTAVPNGVELSVNGTDQPAATRTFFFERAVAVKVFYDGTEFVVSARGETQPEEALNEVVRFKPGATHDRFFVSVGAEDVGAGDEAGVDDIFFAPR